MLKKLQRKWEVDSGRMILILLSFALGGSLCGWAAHKILLLISPNINLVWILFYLIIITLLWPFFVLLISIPLGQFSFFQNFLKRIFYQLLGGKNSGPPVLAIFASGAGSNAENLLQYFNVSEQGEPAKISLIVCNNSTAGVISIAEKFEVPVLHIKKKNFEEGDHYLPTLKHYGITHIILAGFLWKIPSQIVKEYKGKILNIHPALLPKYGGAGMYGKNVHNAVIAAGELQSGITIHEVDEVYDNGKTIFQQECKLEPGETADSLAKKIHQLEHKHFAEVVKDWLSKK